MINKIVHDPVKSDDIYLKKGSSQNLRDTINGKYWHIMLGEKRVGKVYIDFKGNEVLGTHPSLEIFINKQFQRRHIGRFAYYLACLESELDKVYMHTRKSNIGSIRAAQEAGFKHLEHPSFKQVVMVWERNS